MTYLFLYIVMEDFGYIIFPKASFEKKESKEKDFEEKESSVEEEEVRNLFENRGNSLCALTLLILSHIVHIFCIFILVKKKTHS